MSADIDFIMSTSKKKLIQRIEDEIHKRFIVSHGITLQGFMFVFYRVLNDVYQNLHSSLLVNVTNETTEILFVEHGNPRLLTSVPMGPVSAARKVGGELDLPLPIAESYMKLYASEVFGPETTMKLSPVVDKERGEWRALWDKKSEKFPALAKSPYAVFLATAPKYQEVSTLLLEEVLPNKNIVVLGKDNKFTSLVTKSPKGEDVDENLAITCFYDTIMSTAHA